jgi:predicted ATPase
VFLKKITGIKSVGKFRRGGVSGGEYAKYTLFYGGNGRGKTTLCAVFRSLRDNNPSEVNRRQTFGATMAPEVNMLLDSGRISFGRMFTLAAILAWISVVISIGSLSALMV